MASLGNYKGAIYLIGQGTYFRPHLIELQYYRILRYRQLLEKKHPDRILEHVEGIYVDLFPRGHRSDLLSMEDIPQFSTVLDHVKTGQFTQVFLDLLPTDPRGLSYGSLERALRDAGAEVFNASNDEMVLEEIKARYGDAAHYGTHNEHTDFAAFFPTLAGDIGAVLFKGTDAKYSAEGALKTFENRIRMLQESRANASVGYYWPMLPDFLKYRLSEEKNKLDAIARRRQTEPLYCLWPEHSGLLVDQVEGEDRPRAKSPDELRWIEDRLQKMAFVKHQESQRISYILECNGHKLWADPRKAGKLEINVDPEPRNYQSAHTYADIIIQDHEIGRRQESAVRKIMADKLAYFILQKENQERERRRSMAKIRRASSK